MARRRGGGLRGRLDRLEGNAHQTMWTAQQAIQVLREACLGLLEELQDGVTIEVKKTGNLMDFFSGQTDVLPLSIRIVPREPTDETLPPAS